MLGFSTALRRISDRIDRVIVSVVGVLIGLLTLAVLVTILFRFVIQLPVAWAEDVSRGLMVWISLLGASAALKHGLHIAFTSIVDKMPLKANKVFRLIAYLAVFVFLVMIFWLGLKSSIRQWNQTATYFEIPMTYLYAAIPVGMGTMAIHILNNIFALLIGTDGDAEEGEETGEAAILGRKEKERGEES